MNIVTRNIATHCIIEEICMQAASYAENTVKVEVRTECSPLVEQRKVQVAHQGLLGMAQRAIARKVQWPSNVCWVFA